MPFRLTRIALAVVLAVVLIVTAGACGRAASTAPGDLDPSFGVDGKVTTAFGSSATAAAVAIQANGEILAAGSSNTVDFALARYTPDGTLDPVFDSDGKVTTDFDGLVGGVHGLAIQPNGRIVAAGGYDFALARYERDGGLDLTFGGDGKVTTDLGSQDAAEDVVIQADGKIVVAGTRISGFLLTGAFAVARYNPDGSLDTSFGTGGKVLTELHGNAYAVAVQSDGRIVVAGTTAAGVSGYDVALVRYNADGTLDTSFDGDGKLMPDLGAGADDVAFDLAIQSDGKIVVVGVVGPMKPVGADFLVARFSPDGSLDTPFGADGVVATDFEGGYDGALAVAIESGGKIVVAGKVGVDPPDEDPSDPAIARYNVDGSLDQTFGSGGKLITEFDTGSNGIQDLAIQADGGIVAAGGGTIAGVGQFALLRYLAAPCC